MDLNFQNCIKKLSSHPVPTRFETNALLDVPLFKKLRAISLMKEKFWAGALILIPLPVFPGRRQRNHDFYPLTHPYHFPDSSAPFYKIVRIISSTRADD